MNVPPNTRPFSLEMAQQNHPLVTRDGREAKFIAYVPEADKLHKVITFITNTKFVLHVGKDGKCFESESDSDLFLAPVGYVQDKPVFAGDIVCNKSGKEFVAGVIDHAEDSMHWTSCKWPSKAPVGYCQGLPVFCGDKLMWEGDGSPTEIKASVEDNQSFFDHCKWPSKAPVVETRMTDEELLNVELEVMYTENKVIEDARKSIANKAIERAILDGDVIPTSVVKSMLLSAHGDRNNTTCEHMAQIAIDKYLEKLK